MSIYEYLWVIAIIAVIAPKTMVFQQQNTHCVTVRWNPTTSKNIEIHTIHKVSKLNSKPQKDLLKSVATEIVIG